MAIILRNTSLNDYSFDGITVKANSDLDVTGWDVSGIQNDQTFKNIINDPNSGVSVVDTTASTGAAAANTETQGVQAIQVLKSEPTVRSFNGLSGDVVVPIPTALATADDLPEGTTNLYYSDAKVNANVDPKLLTKSDVNHTHPNDADELVKISSADTIPGYLIDKLVSTGSVKLELIHPGGAEQIQITTSSENSGNTFTFSRRGETKSGKWLKVGEVPSNESGHMATDAGNRVTLSVTSDTSTDIEDNDDNSNGVIGLYTRNPNNSFTLIAQIPLVNQRSWVQTSTVTVAVNTELAAKVISGKVKHPVLDIRIFEVF